MATALDYPFFFELAEYLGHGTVADPHIPCCPTQARGPPVLFDPRAQVVEKPLLFFCKFHAPTLPVVIFTLALLGCTLMGIAGNVNIH